jgi:hypothetical protein
MAAERKCKDQVFLETIQTVVTNSRQWQQIFEITELLGPHKLRLLRFDGLSFHVRADTDKNMNFVDVANGTFIFPYKRGNAHSALDALEKACVSANNFVKSRGRTRQVEREAVLSMIFNFLTRFLQFSGKIKILPVNFDPQEETFHSPSIN